MRVENIYISPAHNYFGRWGKGSAKHETIEVDAAKCVAGRGLEGDRFFDYKENYKGQITFFSREVFDGMCQTLNIYDRSPKVVRRNVLVSGVELNELVGQRFCLQGIEFEGISECSPCEWMDEAFGEGAMDYLKGRGGLRCRILNDGVLKKDE